MEKPLVSYVLTAYNIEDFIEESLNEKAAKAGIYTPNNTIIS